MPQLPAIPERLTPSAAVHRLLSARKRSTVRSYRSDLIQFAKYLGAEDVNEAARLLLAHGGPRARVIAGDYKAHLMERYAANTVNRRLTSLRALVRVAKVLEVIDWKDLEVENVEAIPYRDTRGPSVEDVKRIMAALPGDARRNRAILHLLFDVALRRQEVVGLDLEHLDVDRSQVLILAKREHDRRRVTIPPVTLAAVLAWVDERGREPGPLFTNFDRAGKGDGRLTGRSVHRMVRKAGRAVGVEVWPHAFRHGAVTAALDSGHTLREVQRFSRHKDIRTVQIYDDNRQDLGGKVARELAQEVHGEPGEDE